MAYITDTRWIIQHVRERGIERMHVALTEYDMNRMVQQIRGVVRASWESATDTPTRTIWQVYYLRRVFRVVYNEKTRMLQTILPPPSDEHPMTPRMKQLMNGTGL
jgi:hypothetical protein